MSKIEWTQATWNPVTGCTKISEGCQNCYAEKMHKRLQAMGQTKYQEDFNKVTQCAEELHKTFGKKPKMVFVNSMSDLFHNDVFGAYISSVLISCANLANRQHIFQILTKRSDRLFRFHYPDNVWLGVSVELAKYKNRIDDLRNTDAKVKFLSCEPLLGDLGELDLSGIDWVIVGAESGPGIRECKLEWIENIVLQATAAKVPVFVKQAHINGKLVKMPHIFGSEWAEYPVSK